MRTILTIASTAVLAAAIAFYGGVRYSTGGGATTGAGGGTAGSMPASATAGARGGVGGEIIGNDGKSVTVKTSDGSTAIVYLASGTRVTSSSEATLTDLAKGASVVAMGSESTEQSGAVTARTIQIVPPDSDLASFGGMRGAPASTPAAPGQ